MAAAGGAAAPGPQMAAMANALTALVGHGANQEALQKIQYYASGIRKSDGTVPSEFREWLMAIDLVVPQAPNGLVMEVASNSSVGSLNQELEHYISTAMAAMPAGPPAPQRGNVPWAATRAHLQAAFLSINEEENLKLELERITRAAYQQVPQFNVDFRAKAARAYPLPWNQATERILVRAYIRSLADRRLGGKVLDAQPATLNAAMTRADQVAAVDEQRAQLLGPEPMDTSALGYGSQTPAPPVAAGSATDQKLDKLIELLTLQLAGGGSKPSSTRMGTPAQGRARNFQFAPDGRPICSGCNKVGHVWRYCRSRPGAAPAAGPPSSKN